jgi:hypothetical protein
LHVRLGRLLLPMALLSPYSLPASDICPTFFITCTHVKCLLSVINFLAYSAYDPSLFYKSITPTGLLLQLLILSVPLRSSKLYLPLYQSALCHMLEDWNCPFSHTN